MDIAGSLSFTPNNGKTGRKSTKDGGSFTKEIALHSLTGRGGGLCVSVKSADVTPNFQPEL